jgi:ribose 5-phosphate isomerase A
LRIDVICSAEVVMADLTDVKRNLGAGAVDRFVKDGMRLGLGTGSTAIWAARRVAERLADGSLHGVSAVATSLQTDLEARALGIPVMTLNDSSLAGELDLTIDGADEVDPDFNLIKGGGGALLKEKIVAYASRKLLIIVDHTKLSARLCDRYPIPVEVVVDALETVKKKLKEMGGHVALRMAQRKAGPVVTDLGNLLLDVSFPGSFDPAERESELKLIPGVLENGLFTRKIPELLIGLADGSLEHRRKP